MFEILVCITNMVVGLKVCVTKCICKRVVGKQKMCIKIPNVMGTVQIDVNAKRSMCNKNCAQKSYNKNCASKIPKMV